jgi:hypothetical protein
MRRDSAAAMAALPELLAKIDTEDLAKFADTIERLLTLGGPLDAAAQGRLREIRRMLDQATHPAGIVPEPGSDTVAPAPARKRRASS